MSCPDEALRKEHFDMHVFVMQAKEILATAAQIFFTKASLKVIVRQLRKWLGILGLMCVFKRAPE